MSVLDLLIILLEAGDSVSVSVSDCHSLRTGISFRVSASAMGNVVFSVSVSISPIPKLTITPAVLL